MRLRILIAAGVLLLAGVAAAVTSDNDSRDASASAKAIAATTTTTAVRIVPALQYSPDSGDWYAALLAECESPAYVAPPTQASGLVGVPDRATGALAEFTPYEYCIQAAHLAPDPAGELAVNVAVAYDGVLRPDYYWKIEVNGVVAQGAQVLYDEAQRIILEQRRAASRD